MSKQYGSIFTVYFGPKKVVVLAGHQTIKQALVNCGEEFEDRDINPIFQDYNQGYGKRHTYLSCEAKAITIQRQVIYGLEDVAIEINKQFF